MPLMTLSQVNQDPQTPHEGFRFALRSDSIRVRGLLAFDLKVRNESECFVSTSSARSSIRLFVKGTNERTDEQTKKRSIRMKIEFYKQCFRHRNAEITILGCQNSPSQMACWIRIDDGHVIVGIMYLAHNQNVTDWQ